MCSPSCLEFGKYITEDMVKDKNILEIGSRNINGSMRDIVMPLGPKTYLGIDIVRGDGVDMILNAYDIGRAFNQSFWDMMICTEVLEHIKDWKYLLWDMQYLLGQEGYILITTRSPGFPQHDYPGDYWRFTTGNMADIFKNYHILNLESDPLSPGIFILAQKPIFGGGPIAFNNIDVMRVGS